MKLVNLAIRGYGFHKFAGQVDSLAPVGLWDGKEDYDTVKDRCTLLLQYMEKVHKAGGVKFKWPGQDNEEKVLVDWLGGGDMAWIHSCLGFGNWDWCLWCHSNKVRRCTVHNTAASAALI